MLVSGAGGGGARPRDPEMVCRKRSTMTRVFSLHITTFGRAVGTVCGKVARKMYGSVAADFHEAPYFFRLVYQIYRCPRKCADRPVVELCPCSALTKRRRRTCSRRSRTGPARSAAKRWSYVGRRTSGINYANYAKASDAQPKATNGCNSVPPL